jgi:hypothetical protein
VFYDERKQDEIDYILHRPIENLTEILMHKNDADPRFKYHGEVKRVRNDRIDVSTERPKSFKFHSDTWRIFVDGKTIEKKQLGRKLLRL